VAVSDVAVSDVAVDDVAVGDMAVGDMAVGDMAAVTAFVCVGSVTMIDTMSYNKSRRYLLCEADSWNMYCK